MSMPIVCPACGSHDVDEVLSVFAAPTTDTILVNAAADTTICVDCGFAFNASGARGREATFYAEDYDLLAQSDDAEAVYETVAGPRGVNEEMAEYVLAHTDLPTGAPVLDIGCGKGLLLRALSRLRPDLRLSGVEPSRHAYRFACGVAPNARLFNGTLDDSPFAREQFAAIVSANVFEHVPDPVGFARGLAQRLSPKARLFLCVPNLLNNPADIVTYDHLSRFTPATFRAVLGRAGLIVEGLVAGGRVPMWALARRAQAAEVPMVLLDDGNAARDAAAWFGKCLDVYRTLGESPGNRRIGVYGVGLILPAAVAIGVLDAERIVAFFDDNPHMHGATRLGRPVRPLAEAAGLGITDMTFSANPVYATSMHRKVEALGVDLRVWSLPAIPGLCA